MKPVIVCGLYQQEEPIALFSLDGRPHLKLVRIAQTDVSVYQSRAAHFHSFEGESDAGCIGDNGKRDVRNVQMQRRYRDGDKGWKSATTFGLADLPSAIRALQLAQTHVESIEAELQ